MVQLDYQARQAIAAQLGTTCPQLQQAIAPAVLLSVRIDAVESEPAAPAPARPLTRRQLLALAKAARLPGYSRRSTAELAAALAAA